MRIALADYVKPDLHDPTLLPATLSTTYRLASALRQSGIDIRVYQRFNRTIETTLGDLPVVCLADNLGSIPKRTDLPQTFQQRICAAEPDIVHIQGMSFFRAMADLRRQFQGSILLQHHADACPTGLRTFFWKRTYRQLNGFIFPTKDQAVPWQSGGWIGQQALVGSIMEDASTFEPGDENAAPIFLSIGHLTDNKDPITVIKAFARIHQNHPKAKLQFIFRRDDLLSELLKLRKEYGLRSHVDFLGEVSHREIEHHLQRARFFVSASRREGSGYALLEALSTGAISLVSDIPTFAELTKNIPDASIFPIGDEAALANAMLQALSQSPKENRSQRAARYRENWGLQRLVEKWFTIYQTLTQRGASEMGN